jgi:hypothetical protein
MVAAEQVGEPAGAHSGQDAADGAGRGSAPHPKRADGAHAETGERVLRRVLRPLADGQIGAGPGEHRARCGEQHGHQRVAASAAITRVGQDGQPPDDAAFGALRGGGRLGQADSGRLAAHRSSGGAGRLGKVTPSTGAFVAVDCLPVTAV